jgi:Holliday junction resolvasome RuvABC endonuclease subunit
MKVLALDQSTRVTGWSLFDYGKYVTSGIIDLSKIKDTTERTKQMGILICKKIEECGPDQIVIEEVQCQSNVDTVKKLARLQGIAIGFAAANNIPLHILEPTKWRAALGYKQGPKVERKALKQQSIDYVENKFGFVFSEDRSEAICINEAAHKIFNWSDDDDWGI